MGKLFDYATEQNTLFEAWRHIRANGIKSKSEDTRKAVEAFDEDPVRNVRSLQSQLRNDTFAFDYQTGILKRKASGSRRGIVLASIRNRIVERAILDTLQLKCQFVRDVNSRPSSVGGVPDRSVPHGLHLVLSSFDEGKGHFARSDISGFFDHIPRQDVIGFLKAKILEPRFIGLIERATLVTLSNEKALGENRSLFPTDEEGIAQGSPLSPLFGNILLSEFDQQLNNERTTCVRFVDDFVILGYTAEEVRAAFDVGAGILSGLGLECQDPYASKCDPAKADYGAVSDKIIFLGHQIEPGLLQPSRDARGELLRKVRAHISDGRSNLKTVKALANSFAVRNRYIQTLDMVDRVVTGWAESFSYCNSASTFSDLDKAIDKELSNFRSFFRRLSADEDSKGKRRLSGVRLVGDVARRSFDELPRLIELDSRYVRRSATTVSTDGSVYRTRRSAESDWAPGGWAFVTHESDLSQAGNDRATTINRMELTAVIKALECHSSGSLIIRTDSQYVSKTANGNQTTKKNADLWQQFRGLCQGRRIRVVWVKAHEGDPYNEQADRMANAQAKMAAEQLARSGGARRMSSGSPPKVVDSL